MKRTLIVTLLASSLSLAAYAQGTSPSPTTPTPDPNAANAPAGKMDQATPTEKMDQATPTMKAPDSATQTAPTDRVGESVPPMKPSDEKQAGPATTAPGGAATFTATDAEAKNWVGKTVYSSDNKKIGSIAELKRSGDNVSDIEFDNGGFLGFGATRYRVPASDVQQLQADSLVLKVTEAEVQNLPKVEK
jgi:hypothetical protein